MTTIPRCLTYFHSHATATSSIYPLSLHDALPIFNVWKRVDSYAKDGFTAVIHGKYYHEETKATSSQVTKYPSGKYLVVRDMAEAREVCARSEERRVGKECRSRWAAYE